MISNGTKSQLNAHFVIISVVPVLDIVMNGEYHFNYDIDTNVKKSDGELMQVVPIIRRNHGPIMG